MCSKRNLEFIVCVITAFRIRAFDELVVYVCVCVCRAHWFSYWFYANNEKLNSMRFENVHMHSTAKRWFFFHFYFAVKQQNKKKHKIAGQHHYNEALGTESFIVAKWRACYAPHVVIDRVRCASGTCRAIDLKLISLNRREWESETIKSIERRPILHFIIFNESNECQCRRGNYRAIQSIASRQTRICIR